MCLDVVKTNDRNGTSGLRGFVAETPEMNNSKPIFTFKFTNSSSKVKANSSRKILPTVFTPKKRKELLHLFELPTLENSSILG